MIRPAMRLQSPTRVTTGFFDATPLLADPAALRLRAAEDGFLFFRQFLPAKPLWELRRQILDVVNRHGWILAGTEVMDAMADRDAVAASDERDRSLRAIGVTKDAYREIQRLELFHAIPHQPRLLQMYELLFQAKVLPHPRHIARVLLPAPSFTPTAPHQDYVYIHGTHRFWTCWFPLGDVPLALGGLSVLRGSHQEPVLDVMRSTGAGGLEAILCGKDYEWVQDDYRCGDMITFTSHTVHKGLPNQMVDRIRLSCDIRYQPADEDVEEHSLQPHLNVATWDELYTGWTNPQIQYYWKQKPLKVTVATGPTVDIKERRPC